MESRKLADEYLKSSGLLQSCAKPNFRKRRREGYLTTQRESRTEFAYTMPYSRSAMASKSGEDPPMRV